MDSKMVAYLKLIYQSIYLPIHYYKNGECFLRLPQENEVFDFLDSFLHMLRESKKNIHYIVSNEFLYFGIIRNFSTAEEIVVGPVSITPIKMQALHRIMAECSISTEHKDAVLNYFQMTPTFSHNQFLYLLAMLNTNLNHEIIDPFHYFEYTENQPLGTINKEHSTKLYTSKEEDVFHNSYQFERELYRYVENGDIDAIKKLFQKGRNVIAGTIGENSLRQEKNLFIASVTLITRHSISGGLDIETAYQLSDTYIMESEKAQSIEMVQKLSYTAIMDFTERVAANKIPQDMSPDIYQCIQFISTHTNQPISVADVADVVGKSRSYLSKKFKKELGFNLSDFIMRRKLEEGKSLLAYTDKSISEISEYLCFSSQSYFQNVFKKKYHMTPYEYRKSCRVI